MKSPIKTLLMILLGTTALSQATEVLRNKIAKQGSFAEHDEPGELDEDTGNIIVLSELSQAITDKQLSQFCKKHAAKIKKGAYDVYTDAVLHYVCDGSNGVSKNSLNTKIRGKFTPTAKAAFKAARQTGGLRPADTSIPGRAKPPVDPVTGNIPGWYNKYCNDIAKRGRFAHTGKFDGPRDLACDVCKPFFVYYNEKQACKAVCDEGCSA